MQILKWSNNLSIGVEPIDEQHKELFAIFDDLRAAIDNDRGNEMVEEVFIRLENYVHRHFADEEAYMRYVNFPALEAHMAEHEQLLLRLRMLRSRNLRDRSVSAGDIAHFLQEWVVEHVSTSDRMIGEFVTRQS